MTHRPSTIPHLNNLPSICRCRRCDTRRSEREEMTRNGQDWRSDPALQLDHEERAEIAREAEEVEAKKKGDQEFHDATEGHIARELQRSKAQYEKDRAVIDEFAANHPDVAQTPENADLFLEWLKHNAKGVFTKENLEAAYAAVRHKIDHIEILGSLPNGEPEISLKADAYELRKASKEQLKNWMARKRVQEAQQRKGAK